MINLLHKAISTPTKPYLLIVPFPLGATFFQNTADIVSESQIPVLPVFSVLQIYPVPCWKVCRRKENHACSIQLEVTRLTAASRSFTLGASCPPSPGRLWLVESMKVSCVPIWKDTSLVQRLFFCWSDSMEPIALGLGRCLSKVSAINHDDLSSSP